MIFGNRIGKAILLVAVEIAFFILFCAFMLTHQLGKTIAFIIFFIFLGILFKKWEGLNDAVARLFKEMKILAIGVFILMVLTLPFVFQASPYLIHICVMAGLYAILALGLNFQLGSTNVVNFATAASYGIGAYTSALLAVHFHVPFWIGIFLSGSAASLFGLLLGIPCMKTKDYYLSLVTIAFGLIIYILLINFSWTGGPNGIPNIPPPSILGHSFREPINLFGFNLPFQSNYFYLIFIFVIGALLVAYRLHHSRVGLTWNAIREDEIAARCQGIDVTGYKILAFCIDAFFGGVTGTVYAHYIGFISPENFAFIVSVVVVTMVILGGMDNVFGVIIGAVLLTILPEKFRAFEDFRLLIYGVIVVTMLVFRPQGLFPQKLRVYQK
jgi:ABC-type branched-subunit amino acid transport system permease subunit